MPRPPAHGQWLAVGGGLETKFADKQRSKSSGVALWQLTGRYDVNVSEPPNTRINIKSVVHCIGFSPNSEKLAMGIEDHQVMIYDMMDNCFL